MTVSSTDNLHQRLERAGRKVVSDEMIGYSHLYNFDCGCVRVYSVSSFTFDDSETMMRTCPEDGWLSEEE